MAHGHLQLGVLLEHGGEAASASANECFTNCNSARLNFGARAVGSMAFAFSNCSFALSELAHGGHEVDGTADVVDVRIVGREFFRLIELCQRVEVAVAALQILRFSEQLLHFGDLPLASAAARRFGSGLGGLESLDLTFTVS